MSSFGPTSSPVCNHVKPERSGKSSHWRRIFAPVEQWISKYFQLYKLSKICENLAQNFNMITVLEMLSPPARASIEKTHLPLRKCQLSKNLYIRVFYMRILERDHLIILVKLSLPGRVGGAMWVDFSALLTLLLQVFFSVLVSRLRPNLPAFLCSACRMRSFFLKGCGLF